MRNNFCIRFRNELVAFLLKFLFEFKIVFDNSVVHHDNLARAIPVRVSIFFGWAPVSGPARVSYAVGAIKRRFGDRFFEIAELSGRSANLQSASAVDDCDAGRIVAAVLEFAKPFDYDGNDLFGTDVAENSAHK